MSERAAAFWLYGLPFTEAGQLEHSRQHRTEPSEHTLIGHCPVAARIIEIEREAVAANDPNRLTICRRARPARVG